MMGEETIVILSRGTPLRPSAMMPFRNHLPLNLCGIRDHRGWGTRCRQCLCHQYPRNDRAKGDCC